MNHIAEASQKGRWKEDQGPREECRGPREEGWGPRDSRAPVASELPGSWCRALPATRDGQELCPLIPPVRGMAAP